MGGGSSGSGVGVITAITISGCSLLFLALLRSKLAQKEEGESSSSSSSSSSEGIQRKKKTRVVRFAADVEEPRGSGAEYRARLRTRRQGVRPTPAVGGERGSRGGRPAEETQERRRKPAPCGGGGAVGGRNPAIPANRRALYRGLCQYRSQMATLKLYHT